MLLYLLFIFPLAASLPKVIKELTMLTTVHATIICLSCNSRVYKDKYVADMVCNHLFGIGKFLRIGLGIDKVDVAFCIICLHCTEKLSIEDDEDELRQVESLANDEVRKDTMREIEKENRVLKRYTWTMLHSENITPLIEVGWKTVSVK